MHRSASNRELRQPPVLFRRWRPLSMAALPVLAGIAMLGATMWSATHAQAQGATPPGPAVKLYIFDLGSLHSANPEPLLKRGVTVTDMSVVAYLVVHPR